MEFELTKCFSMVELTLHSLFNTKKSKWTFAAYRILDIAENCSQIWLMQSQRSWRDIKNFDVATTKCGCRQIFENDVLSF